MAVSTMINRRNEKNKPSSVLTAEIRARKDARRQADRDHDIKMKQMGITSEEKIAKGGEIGATDRRKMMETGSTLRESMSQEGQTGRKRMGEIGEMNRKRLGESAESGRQILRSTTQDKINQRSTEQQNRSLGERIRQYDIGRFDTAVSSLMAPKETATGEEIAGMSSLEAINQYRNQEELRKAGSLGEMKNLLMLQKIDALSPEDKALFDEMNDEQKQIFLGN